MLGQVGTAQAIGPVQPAPQPGIRQAGPILTEISDSLGGSLNELVDLITQLRSYTDNMIGPDAPPQTQSNSQGPPSPSTRGFKLLEQANTLQHLLAMLRGEVTRLQRV